MTSFSSLFSLFSFMLYFFSLNSLSPPPPSFFSLTLIFSLSFLMVARVFLVKEMRLGIFFVGEIKLGFFMGLFFM